MSSQIIPLKGRTDFRDPAERWPRRLFAWSCGVGETQPGSSARILAGFLRGRWSIAAMGNCHDFLPIHGRDEQGLWNREPECFGGLQIMLTFSRGSKSVGTS